MSRSLRLLFAVSCLTSAITETGAAQGVRDSVMASGLPQRRQRMEQQLRQGIWRIAKQRIGLTVEQMTRLEQTSGRFDQRRRVLNQDERAQRQTLRAELTAGEAGDQELVATALDRLLQLQRQRLDIVAGEQKDLATFMTPIQRAKYAALQEQLRRRVEKVRARRGGASLP